MKLEDAGILSRMVAGPAVQSLLTGLQIVSEQATPQGVSGRAIWDDLVLSDAAGGSPANAVCFANALAKRPADRPADIEKCRWIQKYSGRGISLRGVKALMTMNVQRNGA
jgi:hypothetical protein